MYVRHLSVGDFRSWGSAELPLEPGVSVLIGANGQGKTNLIEAIGYLSTLGSHRVAADAPLVRVVGGESAAAAHVRAAVVSEGRELLLEVEIAAGRANRAKLNRAPLRSPRELLGILRTVLFAPEDLAIVRGDPAERRAFLDNLLVQLRPALAGVRADYDRVLRQRGALLKTAGAARRSSGSPDLRTLDVWDGHLASLGAQLIFARMELVAALRPHVGGAYYSVAAPADDAPATGALVADMHYVSSLGDSLPPPLAPGASRAGGGDDEAGDPAPVEVLEAAMLAELARRRPQEIERGVSLVGPHRDELALSIGGLPARGYASHGESWSMALALRIASFRLMSADGAAPVLLLDDVFAELDGARRARLADLVASAEQVLVTAAVPEDVPGELRGARFAIADGEVTRAD